MSHEFDQHLENYEIAPGVMVDLTQVIDRQALAEKIREKKFNLFAIAGYQQRDNRPGFLNFSEEEERLSSQLLTVMVLEDAINKPLTALLVINDYFAFVQIISTQIESRVLASKLKQPEAIKRFCEAVGIQMQESE